MTISIDIPPSNQDLQTLVASLLSQGVSLGQYHDTSASYLYPKIPTTIPVQPGSNAKPDECWDNCWDMEDKGIGKAVFGWALWLTKGKDFSFLWAQHHAVLDKNNSLIDVTPRNCIEGVEDVAVVFVPDARVAFRKRWARRLPAYLKETGLKETGTSREGWFEFDGEEFQPLPVFCVF